MIQRKYIKHTWNVINLISVFDFIVNIRIIFQIHKSKKLQISFHCSIHIFEIKLDSYWINFI